MNTTKRKKMSIALLPVIFAVAAAIQQLDPAATQLPDFKNSTNGPIGVLTTAAGAPVDYIQINLLNSNLLSNEHYMDEIQSIVRARIPERVVHAPGVGAFGYFEVTHDISHICKAKLFSKVGKKTPIAMRISLTGPRSGAPDTIRGSRGYSVKFYTEEGNFDLIGFNVPLFAFKNPGRVTALINTRKGNPVTELPDPNVTWDFNTQNPEAIFTNMYAFSDFGAPVSYSDMTGHPVHTYQVYNKNGESKFVRWHFIPCKGAKFLNASEFQEVAAGDPHYYARDFYNKIAKGDFPCYHLKAQILSEEDRRNADVDIFDVTMPLDEHRYPLKTIGKVIVNKNCQNHFAEVETLAYSPGNVVPGILGAPDKTFESRRLAYRDAAIHRLGSNYKNIPVNCPIQSRALNYIRDGVPPYNPNVRNGPNYYPNSFNGPVAIVEENRPVLLKIHEKPANNFKQAGKFYRNELNASQKTTLINNIVKDMCPCADTIKNQAVKYFKIINTDFGKGVAEGLANCMQ